ELPHGTRMAVDAGESVHRARIVPRGVHGGVARGAVLMNEPRVRPLKRRLGAILPLRAASCRARASAQGLMVWLMFSSCHPATGGTVLDFWGLGREGEVVAQLIPE